MCEVRIYLSWTRECRYIYFSNICRQVEGRKWILFFQDTNGLLFKVCAGLAASVFPALVIFPVVHNQLEAYYSIWVWLYALRPGFSFTTGYPSSIGCKFNSRFGRQLTRSAPESKRSHWRNFETHSWKRLVRVFLFLFHHGIATMLSFLSTASWASVWCRWRIFKSFCLVNDDKFACMSCPISYLPVH